MRSVSLLIDQRIQGNKGKLTAGANSYETIKELISPLNAKSSSTFHAKLLSEGRHGIEFFEQWGDPIQYENIQGFRGGISEILGDGVCQANTYRLITREMTCLARNQVLTDSQWEEAVKISTQDRYNQALYQVDKGKDANNGLSQAILKRLHLKKIQPLHHEWHYADELAYDVDGLYEILFRAVKEQQSSKLNHFGMVKLSIGHHTTKKDGAQDKDQNSWGHAIYLRYDPKKKVAYFYDPNHGRSINFYQWKKLGKDNDFQKMSSKEQDEAVLNYMLLCFAQMIVNDFDDINTVRSFEMEMDLSFIDKIFSAGNTLLGGIHNFFKKKKEPSVTTENLSLTM